MNLIVERPSIIEGDNLAPKFLETQKQVNKSIDKSNNLITLYVELLQGILFLLQT